MINKSYLSFTCGPRNLNFSKTLTTKHAQLTLGQRCIRLSGHHRFRDSTTKLCLSAKTVAPFQKVPLWRTFSKSCVFHKTKVADTCGRGLHAPRPNVFSSFSPGELYHKIPIISQAWVHICSKGFFAGLIFGELIFGGSYYSREFFASKWLDFTKKNKKTA